MHRSLLELVPSAVPFLLRFRRAALARRPNLLSRQALRRLMNDESTPSYVRDMEAELQEVEQQLDDLDVRRSELDVRRSRLRDALSTLAGKSSKPSKRKRRPQGDALTLQEVRDALAAEQQARPGVAAAELRSHVESRLRAGPKPLTGFGMLFSRLTRQTPAATGTTSPDTSANA